MTLQNLSKLMISFCYETIHFKYDDSKLSFLKYQKYPVSNKIAFYSLHAVNFSRVAEFIHIIPLVTISNEIFLSLIIYYMNYIFIVFKEEQLTASCRYIILKGKFFSSAFKIPPPFKKGLTDGI